MCYGFTDVQFLSSNDWCEGSMASVLIVDRTLSFQKPLLRGHLNPIPPTIPIRRKPSEPQHQICLQSSEKRYILGGVLDEGRVQGSLLEGLIRATLTRTEKSDTAFFDLSPLNARAKVVGDTPR